MFPGPLGIKLIFNIHKLHMVLQGYNVRLIEYNPTYQQYQNVNTFTISGLVTPNYVH